MARWLEGHLYLGTPEAPTRPSGGSKKSLGVQLKKAFTLIELLVVIAIIAILAAILFPVFAQAKEAAKKIADLSNLKQIGTSTYIYLNDYDDTLYAHRWNCGGNATNNYTASTVCPDYLGTQANGLNSTAPDQAGGLTSPVNMREYWVYVLQPYTKSYPLFKDPDQSQGFYPGNIVVVPFLKGTGAQNGNNYGGQNSYGHNDVWLSPGANTNGGSANLPTPPTTSQIPRIGSTIMIVDGSYYGAGADLDVTAGGAPSGYTTGLSGVANPANFSGNEWKYATTSGGQYPFYWMNQGGGLDGTHGWADGTDNPNGLNLTTSSQEVVDALSSSGIQSRHGGHLNVQWTDSHAKNLSWTQTVGNVCLWTTDADGAHPNCGD